MKEYKAQSANGLEQRRAKQSRSNGREHLQSGLHLVERLDGLLEEVADKRGAEVAFLLALIHLEDLCEDFAVDMVSKFSHLVVEVLIVLLWSRGLRVSQTSTDPTCLFQSTQNNNSSNNNSSSSSITNPIVEHRHGCESGECGGDPCWRNERQGVLCTDRTDEAGQGWWAGRGPRTDDEKDKDVIGLVCVASRAKLVETLHRILLFSSEVPGTLCTRTNGLACYDGKEGKASMELK